MSEMISEKPRPKYDSRWLQTYRWFFGIVAVALPIVFILWSLFAPGFVENSQSVEEQALREGRALEATPQGSFGPVQWVFLYGAITTVVLGVINLGWPHFCAQAIRLQKYLDDRESIVRQTRISGVMFFLLSGGMVFLAFLEGWWGFPGYRLGN